jgi:hypothetical protein
MVGDMAANKKEVLRSAERFSASNTVQVAVSQIKRFRRVAHTHVLTHTSFVAFRPEAALHYNFNAGITPLWR